MSTLFGKTKVVAYGTKRQRRNHINDGMLLYKHGGNADEHRNNGGNHLILWLLQSAAVPKCERPRKGADYMDGRAYVGVRIELIETAYHPGKQVLPFKFRRAQILTGREKKIYYDSRCVGENYEIHHLFERRNVVEKCIRNGGGEPNKPKQVWDKEPFAEGDGVIQRAVHGIVFFDGIIPLHIVEKQPERRPEKQKQNVAELVCIQLAEPEISVINRWLLHKSNPFRIKCRAKPCQRGYTQRLYSKIVNKSSKPDKIRRKFTNVYGECGCAAVGYEGALVLCTELMRCFSL